MIKETISVMYKRIAVNFCEAHIWDDYFRPNALAFGCCRGKSSLWYTVYTYTSRCLTPLLHLGPLTCTHSDSNNDRLIFCRLLSNKSLPISFRYDSFF